MNARYSLPALAGVLSAVAALAGCRGIMPAAAVVTAVSATPGPVLVAAAQAPLAPTPSPPPASLETPLTAFKAGPPSKGLLLCDPVIQNADAATADFGAGCARWLYFTVGGRPALGRTPLWAEVEQICQERSLSPAHLALPDAVRVGGVLGVTDVAVGTVSGSAAHTVLTYRLWAVPHGGAVGPPLTTEGTQAQVLSALPGLGAALARRLGDAAPGQPLSVGAAPAEVVLAGAVPWGPASRPNASQQAALLKAAPHWPLAGFLALNDSLRGDPRLQAVAAALIRQAPDNALAYAQIAYQDPLALRAAAPALAALRRRAPGNYALAHTDIWWGRATLNAGVERAGALACVRDAPGNPCAWLALGYTLSDEGEAVRKSRLAGQLSDQEWRYLNAVYAQWLAATSRAVRLDPRDGHGWLRLAQAATFAGQVNASDAAFWNALKLDPDRTEVYDWGLQMYQEKWGGDPATLAKVAGLAAADHYPSEDDAETIAESLQGAGFDALATALMQRVVADERGAVAANPKDATAHWGLAFALSKMNQSGLAVPEYRTAIGLMPGNAALHHDLAEALFNEHLYTQALAEYKAAVTLDARPSKWHYDYGWDLKHLGHLTVAEQEMRQAILRDPTSAYGYFGLGLVLELTHRPLPAITEYQKASSLQPTIPEARARLTFLLDSVGRYDAAIAEGQQDLLMEPGNTDTMDSIADCYLHKKQWSASVASSQQALQINPADAVAHENLAEASLGQGNRARARAEWRQVLLLDQGAVAQAARGYLAKYP